MPCRETFVLILDRTEKETHNELPAPLSVRISCIFATVLSLHLLFMMILDGIQQQEQVDLEIDVDLLLFSVAKYQQYVPVRITYSRR